MPPHGGQMPPIVGPVGPSLVNSLSGLKKGVRAFCMRPPGCAGALPPLAAALWPPCGGQSQAAQRAPVMRGESAPRPIAQAAFSAQGLHKRLRRPCAVCRQRSGRGLPSSPLECVPRIPPRRGATVAPFGRFPSLAVAPAGRARARENKKALPWQRY